MEFDGSVLLIEGGPGSAKSTVLEAVRCEYQDRVIIVPEAATLLLQSGHPPPGEDPNIGDLRIFQQMVYSMVREMEQEAKNRAAAQGVRLVICERGTLSGAAYVPGGYQQFARWFGIPDLDSELRRYHRVMVFQTLAIFPDLWEPEENNINRMEKTPKIAHEIDDRIWCIYRDHPSVERLRARREGHAHKVDRTLAVVREFLED